MKKMVIGFLVFAVLLLSYPTADGTIIVGPSEVVLATGDTVFVALNITEDSSAVMTFEMLFNYRNDSTRSWYSAVVISPDVPEDADNEPEVSVAYTPPTYSDPNPYDVNRDGFVDGKDLLAVLLRLWYGLQ